MRGIFSELEDLWNRAMRCNLIFKGIHEKDNVKWEDTSMVLATLIKKKLDLPYSFEETDLQISRAHRASGTDE